MALISAEWLCEWVGGGGYGEGGKGISLYLTEWRGVWLRMVLDERWT